MLRGNAFLLYLAMCLLVFAQPGLGAPVSIDVARQVAQNFLDHEHASHTIESVQAIQSGEKQVGYLVQLAPQGYILVAGDDIRVPVKGYSLNSTFSDLPEPYSQNLLRELEIDTTSAGASAMSAPQTDDTNAPLWGYLLQTGKQLSNQTAALSYTPDTYLVTTKWNQTYPYNKLNPKIGDTLTLTGCVQTAVAQMMRYHANPATGSGQFTHLWNSQPLSAVMNRPFNWNVMPNKVDGSAPEYQQDEVAALMRDLGILNQANFGTLSTSASFNNSSFSRAFGYAPISTVHISNLNFFTIIKNEIDNLRPMLLTMPGHMTVADGYASDGTGKKIHVNLGWGGSNDDYYYLDQTNVIGPYSFSPDHSISYNIRPCVAGECNPYPPATGTQPPTINSSLPDMVIDGASTIRLDVYDPEGDTVTLSALSSCDGLQVTRNANLLTLTPVLFNSFCQVAIQADSDDGSTSRTFKVLSRANKIYFGTKYDIGGKFANVSEEDAYLTYLGGAINVSGNRGYSNQAFYIWIKDQNGNTVLGPSNSMISGTLSPGFYTVTASLTSGYSNYTFSEDFSGYTLSVSDASLNYTVSNLAESLNISLAPLYPESRIKRTLLCVYSLLLQKQSVSGH